MRLDIFALRSLNLSSGITHRSSQAILANGIRVTQFCQKTICVRNVGGVCVSVEGHVWVCMSRSGCGEV